MSRIKIKTRARNTLFCIMFTLRRSQNYSEWSTPSQNKQAFECLSYPWLASFSGVDFLQLSDTDVELRTFSWPWLIIRNTPSALNCVILCLYWAFHLELKSFSFSWRETFRQITARKGEQQRPGTWKSCLFISRLLHFIYLAFMFQKFGIYIFRSDLLLDSENDPLIRF